MAAPRIGAGQRSPILGAVTTATAASAAAPPSLPPPPKNIVLLYLKLYLNLFDLKLQLRAQLRASASPGPGAGALRDKHKSRWKAFPGLRDSDVKEACLFCWKTRRLKFWDSEWHAIFDCPTCRTPRQRFQLALRASPNKVVLKPLKQRNRLTISSDLASLVLKCRSDEQLVCDLARFVVDSLSCRQQAFRKLDVRDIFPTV